MDVKHIWSVICKESVINQEDNVISLLNVIEELTVSIKQLGTALTKLPEKINIPIAYEVVSYWVREETKAKKIDIKTTVTSPDGEVLLNNEHSAIFPENNKRLRTRLKIQGFVVKTGGQYLLTVYIKNKDKFDQVSQIPIELKIKKDTSSLKS